MRRCGRTSFCVNGIDVYRSDRDFRTGWNAELDVHFAKEQIGTIIWKKKSNI